MTLLRYKFRLYPTKEQVLVLEQTLDGCRWVYNYFLSLPSPMSEYDMNFALTELKEQHPWLRNYHHKVLQMVCKQVVTATKDDKGRKDRLSYQKHDDFNSFTYNQSGFRLESNMNRLSLSKIRGGSIRIALHRKPLKIHQVTISRKNSKWYAVVTCEEVHRTLSAIVKYNKKRPIGVDFRIAKSHIDSDGHIEDKNPWILTELERPLRRAHRRVSRRQVGSSNHKKAMHMLARLYGRIHNKRKDFLRESVHCASRRNNHLTIFLERLQLANPIKKNRLCPKTLRTDWSATFKKVLRPKGSRVLRSGHACTSIDHLGCRFCLLSESPAVGTHVRKYTECKDTVLDRDYSASVGIFRRERKTLAKLLLLPVERREVTPVEIALARSGKQEEVLVFGHG